MRCLLDKVTARRILEGLLKLGEARELTEDELFTLDFYARAEVEGLRLFISSPTEYVLQRLETLPRYSAIIHSFRNRVEVAFTTRHFKRWARRLRDYGFTREDAAILALGTFSISTVGGVLGMDFVVTSDQPMIHQRTMQYAAIQDHLIAMQENLSDPYRQAPLPQVLLPHYVSTRS
jgi:hypothetical protein